jgi:hypothetical protein
VICAAASVYLIYVLEIFKFKGLRSIEIRRADPAADDDEIDDRVAKDIETGEFEKVK